MISFREALDTSRNNPQSEWPARGPDSRLEPFANPSFDSGVALQPGAKVVTMGSCFARNIEEYFEAEGFDVPLMGYSAPVEEYGQGGRIQGILNKYTIASIGIEIEWLARVKAEGGTVTWENVEHMMLDIGGDKILDLQLSSGVPVSRERAVERRQQIYDLHVQIFACDLVVLTPGLTETWFDTKTGLHIQRMPGARQVRVAPDRFTFEVMDFFQCFEILDKTIRTLRENGTRQIAMTVSPVPLQRTMTDKDILIANTYSKSTLRSAVGLICDRYDFVHYVPSYERVTLSKDPSVWGPDLRHVTKDFVGTIASTFAASALGQSSEMTDAILAFNTAIMEKRTTDAVTLLDFLGDDALNVSLYGFAKAACRLLIDEGRFADAMPFANRVRELRPHQETGYKLEYRIHLKLGDTAAADQVAEEAVENCRDLILDEFKALKPRQK